MHCCIKISCLIFFLKKPDFLHLFYAKISETFIEQKDEKIHKTANNYIENFIILSCHNSITFDNISQLGL